jgi:hypothetical protein
MIKSRRNAMIAKNPGRTVRWGLVALVTAGSVGGFSVFGQQPGTGRAPAKGAANPKVGEEGEVKAVIKAVPVNPNDPVAIINGEPITRVQLSDECVARKGKEILETLIARKLIEQAMQRNKMQITAAEIETEIENLAMRMAQVSKEKWLATLDKERGISPMQYRRDIVYPALALRRMAAPRVEVTANDIQVAYEAKYGDKLVCRMIALNSDKEAKEVWAKVKQNPAGFQKEAELRSQDESTRAMGGLLGRPLSRHENPLALSDKAFRDLVDGEPNDHDPTHKPKNGDISGIIEVGDARSWVILKRENVIPAQAVNKNDPYVQKDLKELMYEAKVQREMAVLFEQISESATIDNLLTGHTRSPKLDAESKAYNAETKQPMATDPRYGMRSLPLPEQAAKDSSVGRAKAGPPIGVSPDDKPFSDASKKAAGTTNK